MRFACCVTKATNPHSEYVILIAFHGNNSYTNVPQCYVMHMLPVLFEYEAMDSNSEYSAIA
jgi:hypothetical protein